MEIKVSNKGFMHKEHKPAKEDVDIKDSREMSDAIVINFIHPGHQEPRGDDHNYPGEKD